jgi:shikimate dehydrogenase
MKRYGLIGYPLSHSFSQRYFADKFLQESIENTVYENYPIPSIQALESILDQYPDLCGFNITIPYKKDILAYLSSSTHAVQQMGACNCVKITNGKLIGYNTDVIGFERSLLPFLKPRHQQALILGTGGASAAVAYVLQQLQIHFKYVSRKKSDQSITYEEVDERMIQTHQLIINTTPLGMHPSIDEYPVLPYQFMNETHHCFDLIYNPTETMFLQKAKASGASIQNGAEMLVIQAEESWRIWTTE